MRVQVVCSASLACEIDVCLIVPFLSVYSAFQVFTMGQKSSNPAKQKLKISEMEFCLAVRGGRTDEVRRLIAQGADVNKYPDLDYFRPFLQEAALLNHVDIVNLFMRAKASVNTIDNVGRTPLFDAAETGNVELIEFLLAHKANVNHADIDKTTPLMRACICGKAPAAQAILEAGADLHATNDYGRTALDFVLLDNEQILENFQAELKLTARKEFWC